MFRAKISPILRSTRLCLQLGIMHRRCCLWAAPSVHYIRSCKHSLVLLRMGEIIARNMLSWLKLLIKLLLLHLIGCLYYCISDARSHTSKVPFLFTHGKQWLKLVWLQRLNWGLPFYWTSNSSLIAIAPSIKGRKNMPQWRSSGFGESVTWPWW